MEHPPTSRCSDRGTSQAERPVDRCSKSSALGSKGVGELGICAAGAAVANAVYNACGVRVRDYPITPDKVLNGLLRTSLAQQR